MQSYDRFLSGLKNFANTFETFHENQFRDNSTMRQAYDALFVYVEQELQQARQQLVLGDLKRKVLECRQDVTRKLSDYSREIDNLEKDVKASEKKLNKNKDALNKLVESKIKMDAKDAAREAKHHNENNMYSIQGQAQNDISIKISGGSDSSPSPAQVQYEFDSTSSPHQDHVQINTAVNANVNMNMLKKPSGASNFISGALGGIDDKVQTIKSDIRAEKRRELADAMNKVEKDVASDIRSLLRAISNQDQILLGLRKAYQAIDVQCKSMIKLVFKSLVEREEESSQAKVETLGKLSHAVRNIDVNSDILEFITQNSDEHDSNSGDGSIDTGPLVLYGNALNVMEDTMSSEMSILKKKRNSLPLYDTSSTGTGTGSNTPSESSPPIAITAAAGGNRSRTSTRDDLFSNEQSRDSIGNEKTNSNLAEECTLHLSRLFYCAVGLEDTQENNDRRKSIMTSSFGSILQVELQGSSLQVDDEKNKNENTKENEDEDDSDDHDPLMNPKAPSPLVAAAIEMNINKTSRTNSNSNRNNISLTMPPVNGCDRMNSLCDKSPISIINHCKKFILPSSASSIEKSKEIATSVESSVMYLVNVVQTQTGRNEFITSLNTFRSKKVDVGAAYHALSAVLWISLDLCCDKNDIHTAKVIMMLSQTFYRMKINTDETQITFKSSTTDFADAAIEKIENENQGNSKSNDNSYNNNNNNNKNKSKLSRRYSESSSDTENDEGEIAGRGAGVREYLKDVLIPHNIWKDGKFWERVLWECALEQLHIIPYDVPWHEMSPYDRKEAVRRVHNVVMSQVMAVEHSMLELGCGHGLVREFIYRMCVLHQLSENQKHTLVLHLQSQSKVEKEKMGNIVGDGDVLETSI
jgi:hypothetical protein